MKVKIEDYFLLFLCKNREGEYTRAILMLHNMESIYHFTKVTLVILVWMLSPSMLEPFLKNGS